MKDKILATLLTTLIIIGALPIISDCVQATELQYDSEPSRDGMLYLTVTEGVGSILNSEINGNSMTVGREYQSGTPYVWSVYESYVSFNTSALPTGIEIVSAELFARVETIPDPTALPFNVEVLSVDFGNVLNTVDWERRGASEGTLCSSKLVSAGEWVSMPVAPERVNTTLRTQYKFDSSRRYPDPTSELEELITFYTGETTSSPYLIINAGGVGGAIVTYNFTNIGAIPTNAVVEYWDEHITFQVEQGFEGGVFPANWTTFGSPVVTTSYAPYEGLYHAGASVGESGAGNHTFQVPVDATGLFNITVDYYRKVQDVGGGTVSFIADWYNGTAWNELENLTSSTFYELSSWRLNSTADNNPNLIFRWNVTLTAGAVNNGAWIDNAELITKSGFHEHSNSTTYPNQCTDWNETHEQVRYEVYVDELHPTIESWIYVNVNDTFIFQSIHPNTINVIDEGNGQYNITDQQHQETYHSMWFLKPLSDPIGTNHTSTVYPVEVIDHNSTWEQVRYEVFLLNETYANFQVEPNYTYQSHHPSLNVTLLNATTGLYNFTESYVDFEWFHIWFLRPKAITTTTVNIQLWHSTLGEGFFWEKWAVWICNDTTFFDQENATRVFNRNHIVPYGHNYTLGVTDYFGNEITNQTFTANAPEVDVLIPVPVYQLNLKSFRRDTTAYAIYFNATGIPFQDHVPSETYDEIAIREGTYMFQFDLLSTPTNQSATVLNTIYINLTINATYTINIGNSGIDIIITTVNGINLLVNTISIAVQNGVNIILVDPAHANVDGTRAGFPEPEIWTRAIDVLDNPYWMLEAIIFDNVTASQSYEFADHRPNGTITETIFDELTIWADWDTNIMLNNSGGNFLNLTSPQRVNLLQFDNTTNITLWSNKSVNAYRETQFRLTQIFIWNWNRDVDSVTTALTLNNSATSKRWYDLHWYVPVAKGSVIDLEDRPPTVFDSNNSVYLDSSNFTVTNQGFHLVWDFLNAGIWRGYTFTYYLPNRTYDDTEIIVINSYSISDEKFGENYHFGQATFNNHRSLVFTGEIIIKLQGLPEGTINPDKVWVWDEDRDVQLGANDYAFTPNQILITTDGIRNNIDADRGLPSSASVTYTVYFQFTDLEPARHWFFAGWFNIGGNYYFSLHTLLLIIGIAILVYSGLFYKRGDKSKEAELGRRLFYELAGVMIAVWSVALLLNLQGIVQG
jgi:hypothetical protein